MAKTIKTIIFFVLIIISVQYALSYDVDYSDDYTPYGSNGVDAKSWSGTAYLLEYELWCGGGETEPHIIVTKRDSGQIISALCRTDTEAQCALDHGEIDYDTCTRQNVGDMCGESFGDGFSDEIDFTDRLYMDVYYMNFDESECIKEQTDYETYNIINNSYYECYNETSYRVNANSYNWEEGIKGAEYEISIGNIQTCQENEVCDTTYQNQPQSLLPEKDWSTIACIDCDDVPQIYTSYCTDIKHYKIFTKPEKDTCGNIWIQNSTIKTCEQDTLCKLTSNQTLYDREELDSPCMGSSDTTTFEMTDDWDLTKIIESTNTDYIIMNDSNISITTDGITTYFPEEITCISLDKEIYIQARLQINGEYIYINYGNTKELEDGTIITFQDYDYSTQTFTFRIHNDISTCSDQQISRYDYTNVDGGSIYPTITYLCGGIDYEITLYYVDYAYYHYVCYGNEEMMATCIESSWNYTNGQGDLNTLSDLSIYNPERLLTDTSAWESLNYNINKNTGEYQIKTKYFTKCVSNDNVALTAEGLGNYSRLTTIYSTNEEQLYIINKRQARCEDDTIIRIDGYYSQSMSTVLPLYYACDEGTLCSEEIVKNSTNKTGLVEAKQKCVNASNGNCYDQIKNQNEVDVDYGGICGRCIEGSNRNDDTDYLLLRQVHQKEAFKEEWCENTKNEVIGIISVLLMVLLVIVLGMLFIIGLSSVISVIYVMISMVYLVVKIKNILLDYLGWNKNNGT